MGMIRHSFNFGSVKSDVTLAMEVYGCEGVDDMATQDITSVIVPGRNGVLHLDNHRWNERTISYLCYVPATDSISYANKLETARNRLSYFKGYQRLTDTFYPDYYYRAAFVGTLEAEPMAFRTKGLVKFTFSLRPERFLTAGESAVDVTSSLQIVNPTTQESKPEIFLGGSGAVTLTFTKGDQSRSITVSDVPLGGVTIYCEDCEAYSGSTPVNDRITAAEFPVLYPGTTTITYTGNVTVIKLVPRWWTL